MTITQSRLKEVLSYDDGSGQFTWRVACKPGWLGRIAGAKCPRGYLRIKVDQKLYLAHRLAWLYMTGDWPDALIDHVNNDNSDNRFANLRQATPAQNARNSRRHSNNRQPYKGVAFDPRPGRQNYIAHIMRNGKQCHIGVFKTAEAAHAAYCEAALSAHGQFANFG